jgi:hypothetical protein
VVEQMDEDHGDDQVLGLEKKKKKNKKFRQR